MKIFATSSRLGTLVIRSKLSFKTAILEIKIELHPFISLYFLVTIFYFL